MRCYSLCKTGTIWFSNASCHKILPMTIEYKQFGASISIP